jgi:hypothetical protein
MPLKKDSFNPRLPLPKKTERVHRDRNRYRRKIKHKKGHNDD